MGSRSEVTERLVGSYGYTFGDLTNATIRKNDRCALFELLCLSIMAGTGTGGWAPWAALAGLKEENLGTPERMAASPWKQKVHVLNDAGFVRSPERTALILTRTAEEVRDRYDGDLGNLREAAGRDPQKERELLRELKGMNDTRVDLFFREAQSGWSELNPFADEPVLRAAGRLGLCTDVDELADSVGRDRFPRLIAALGHVDRMKIYDVFDGQPESARVIDLRMGSKGSTRLRGAS